MDSQTVHSYYLQLIDLTQQQLNFIRQSIDTNPFDELHEIEQKKNELINLIEASNNVASIKLDEESSNMLKEDILSLIELTTSLQSEIDSLYNSDAQEMRQVSQKRKTLKAYGGLYNSDVVPLYFDEKK